MCFGIITVEWLAAYLKENKLAYRGIVDVNHGNWYVKSHINLYLLNKSNNKKMRLRLQHLPHVPAKNGKELDNVLSIFLGSLKF